jgi:hypothetical protein
MEEWQIAEDEQEADDGLIVEDEHGGRTVVVNPFTEGEELEPLAIATGVGNPDENPNPTNGFNLAPILSIVGLLAILAFMCFTNNRTATNGDSCRNYPDTDTHTTGETIVGWAPGTDPSE